MKNHIYFLIIIALIGILLIGCEIQTSGKPFRPAASRNFWCTSDKDCQNKGEPFCDEGDSYKQICNKAELCSKTLIKGCGDMDCKEGICVELNP